LDEGQATLIAIGLGFAVALIVIVAAFFQEPIVAVAQATARGVARVLAPAAGALSAAIGASGRRVAATAAGAPSRIGRAFAAIGSAEREPSRRRRSPLRAAPSPVRAAAAPPADRGTSAQPVADAAPPTEPEEPQTAQEPRRRRTAEEAVGPGRLYAPTSSLNMEAAARDFLRPRGGQVPVDSLVRHLDQQFGATRGAVVLEVLRRRGLVRVSRDPDAPTRMLATLVDEPTGSHGDA
jgi:hypothetical protein